MTVVASSPSFWCSRRSQYSSAPASSAKPMTHLRYGSSTNHCTAAKGALDLHPQQRHPPDPTMCKRYAAWGCYGINNYTSCCIYCNILIGGFSVACCRVQPVRAGNCCSRDTSKTSISPGPRITTPCNAAVFLRLQSAEIPGT